LPFLTEVSFGRHVTPQQIFEAQGFIVGVFRYRRRVGDVANAESLFRCRLKATVPEA
jgi:hypothetical protein